MATTTQILFLFTECGTWTQEYCKKEEEKSYKKHFFPITHTSEFSLY